MFDEAVAVDESDASIRLIRAITYAQLPRFFKTRSIARADFEQLNESFETLSLVEQKLFQFHYGVLLIKADDPLAVDYLLQAQANEAPTFIEEEIAKNSFKHRKNLPTTEFLL